eukprot:gene2057-2536_t
MGSKSKKKNTSGSALNKQQTHQQQQQLPQKNKQQQQQSQPKQQIINDKNYSVDQIFLNLNLDQLKNAPRGYMKTSQQQYTSYLGDVPQTAICAMRIGNNEYYKEHYKLAIEYYNSAITLSANNPSFILLVLINRSITKLRLQEYKKSILDSTLAISIQPHCIKAYICRSFGYFFTNDFKKAFSDHLIATNLTPSHITLQQVMKCAYGSTFIHNPNFQESLISNPSLLSQKTESLASKQKLLGNADFQDKNYLAALGHYTKAIRLNPEYYEAITDCSISIEKQLKQIKAYLRRGSSYTAIGDYRAAVNDFRTGLKYEPESVDLLDGLMKALRFIEQELRYKFLQDPKSDSLAQALKTICQEIQVLNSKIGSNKLSSSQNEINQPTISTPQSQPTMTSSPPKYKIEEIDISNTNQPTKNNISTPPYNNVNKFPKTSKNRIPYYRPVTRDHKEKQYGLIKYFTHLIEKKIGNTSSAYLGRGEAYLQLSDFKNALTDYEKGLELDPKDPDLRKRINFVITYGHQSTESK